MEDEGFVDDDFIEERALEYVARYGASAVRLLRERAAIADAAGDYLLVQAWREVLAAAERLLAEE